MSYDFTGLTNAQAELLTYQGWEMGSTWPTRQPHPLTVKKLIERGLLIEHVTTVGRMTVREYEVPLSVHMAWCEHCGKEYAEMDSPPPPGEKA